MKKTRHLVQPVFLYSPNITFVCSKKDGHANIDSGFADKIALFFGHVQYIRIWSSNQVQMT